MPTNRAFFSQEWVAHRLAEGRISLEGEVLTLAPDGTGPAFRLSSAVLFQSEVASGHDAPRLCGRVKTLVAVSALSGEHAPGSVVLGDHAYEVVDGFLGELVAVGAGAGATDHRAQHDRVSNDNAGIVALDALQNLVSVTMPTKERRK